MFIVKILVNILNIVSTMPDFQWPYTLDRYCSRYMYGLAYGMA